MKVFLTGSMGYVGNILAEMLVEEKIEVVGCDVGWYPQNFKKKEFDQIKHIKKDVRNLNSDDLKGFDVVMHLAGLSNDPVGEINPDLTNDINYLASVNLAKLSKKAGVNRFIFSSSCSNYGASTSIVNENSELSPLTAYAKSKVNSEKSILSLQDNQFVPIILRNATVYGLSPSLRMDLVVNNLTGSAVSSGSVKLLSDGKAWRPLLHIKDMARAFLAVSLAEVKQVKGEIFNVGSNQENYTVREIAEKVNEVVPNSQIEFAENANKDNRSYKVDFSKIYENIGFETKWNLEDGIKEIYEFFKEINFSKEDFNSKDFYRVKYLKWMLENKILDNNLFLQK